MTRELPLCPLKLQLRDMGVTFDSYNCDGVENCFVEKAFGPGGLPALAEEKSGKSVGGAENPIQAVIVSAGSCIKK